jgi:hypothetical protein
MPLVPQGTQTQLDHVAAIAKKSPLCFLRCAGEGGVDRSFLGPWLRNTPSIGDVRRNGLSRYDTFIEGIIPRQPTERHARNCDH